MSGYSGIVGLSGYSGITGYSGYSGLEPNWASPSGIGTSTPNSGYFTSIQITEDRSDGTVPYVPNIIYGTGDPPIASTVPIGTIYIKYAE